MGSDYENRIIFITDQKPSFIAQTKIIDCAKKYKKKKIGLSFIAIDFTCESEWVDLLAKIPGCNYFCAKAPKDLKRILDEGFDYLTTSLVYNMEIKFESTGYGAERVWGSNQSNEVLGEITRASTLFPCRRYDREESKGGIMLIKLNKKIIGRSAADFVISFETALGEKKILKHPIVIKEYNEEYYDNKDIQKAILLVRYVNLLKHWILDSRCDDLFRLGNTISLTSGISVPPKVASYRRGDVPLIISQHYKTLFYQFGTYFHRVLQEIGDGTLEQELGIIHYIGNCPVHQLSQSFPVKKNSDSCCY